MQLAISLGEKGRITAPPNPWVGCVIVKDGELIGEGFHKKAGEEHAEVNALRMAGARAKGASAYVTLEPCCHFGRTPPCVNALIEAKISKVFVALLDPDSKVAGNGIATLKKAGIEVSTDLLRHEAASSLEPYLHHRTTGLPFCVAKVAISLDGRTAAVDRSSQWITSEEARKDSHRIRAESQAILVGSQTALIDRPRLTVRDVEPMPFRQPLKIVVDSSGQVIEGFDLIFSCVKNPDVIQVSRTKEGVNLKEVLEILGKKGVMQVMVEGGATLLGSFLRSSLINKLVVYVGPRILGQEGLPLFCGLNISTITESFKLQLLDVKKIEDCVRLTYSM